jgi:hypothetical protein
MCTAVCCSCGRAMLLAQPSLAEADATAVVGWHCQGCRGKSFSADGRGDTDAACTVCVTSCAQPSAGRSSSKSFVHKLSR